MRKLAIVLLPLVLLTLVIGAFGCGRASYIQQTVHVPALSSATITIHHDRGYGIEGSFTVLENDIWFYIKDPARRIIYDVGRVEHDTFYVPCNYDGYYTLYFDNEYSILTEKTVYLRYRIR